MKSNISFLKLTGNLWKKQTWLFIIFSVLYFMAIPMAGMMHVSASYNGYLGHAPRDMAGLIRMPGESAGICMWLMLITSAILGMLSAWEGFSYLHDRAKTDFFHSIPVSRTRLFAVRLGICAIDYLIPVTANTLLLLLAGLVRCRISLITAGAALEMILIGFVITFLFFSIACLAMMLTGRALIAVLLTLALELGPPVYGLINRAYMDTFFYTFSQYGNSAGLTESVFSSWGQLAIYLGPIKGPALAFSLLITLLSTGILLGLDLLLYRKRPLEKAGRPMVFKPAAEGICMIISVYSGLIFGLFFRSMIGGADSWFFFGLVFGCFLSYLFIRMLYRESPKKAFSRPLPLAVCLAAVVTAGLFFRFDLIGFDRFLPAYDNLNEITLLMPDSYYYPEDGNPDEKELLDSSHIKKDRETYAILKELVSDSKHFKDMKADKYDGDSEYDPADSVTVEARFSDRQGHVYYRTYRAFSKTVKKASGTLYSQSRGNAAFHPILQDRFPVIYNMKICNGLSSVEIKSTDINKSGKMKEIAEALKEDGRENAGKDIGSQIPVAYISYSYQEESSDYGSSPYSIWVFPTDTHTLAVLKKYGMEPAKPVRAEDILYMRRGTFGGKIRDQKEIQELLPRLVISDFALPWLELEEKAGVTVYLDPASYDRYQTDRIEYLLLAR